MSSLATRSFENAKLKVLKLKQVVNGLSCSATGMATLHAAFLSCVNHKERMRNFSEVGGWNFFEKFLCTASKKLQCSSRAIFKEYENALFRKFLTRCGKELAKKGPKRVAERRGYGRLHITPRRCGPRAVQHESSGVAKRRCTHSIQHTFSRWTR